ncbi:putative dihydroxyacetone phosphate acyltransferase [Trypanosoma rangeli]|uniref:Putative dihydroxyacetone phosphate acyltransferase n=1 Tax=Trypanosoma rangeli TaxID=5698 RepID=A0A422MV29_TRYRA|nr:putative dihydroxyacetone phosphate acyltransferase [Trypanosoma rangeli]RNE97094.1 putative dihydroxyacetone phosphate acyltransferase [Trypanosoma rangeli]|eukprot:RNE97094.1 putative dihydroxyacetone phosphate acyltransferase [Trypanosoma rangeli]
MVLAFCHYIPRDVVLQVCLFFLLLSCILQAILVGSHGKERGSGTIGPRDATIVAGVLVHIGARSAIYTTDQTKICVWSSNSDIVSVGCARFVEAFHVVRGPLLSSFIVSVLSLLFAVFYVVPMSRTTTALVLLVQLPFFLPTVLHTAAVVFFSIDADTTQMMSRAEVSFLVQR